MFSASVPFIFLFVQQLEEQSRAPATGVEGSLSGPVDESKNQLPDILCVVQVCPSRTDI
ncbi:hypothetical protein DY000_02057928 [Brassica cretica]|uniref:Uncharacterized protein n=1 Tax=Brassica cretica TaxID=69181 RepID=A0ABQ7AK00_BRACR|nr:hypothetical protein DY000_02057928 [Brassica cretica]